MKLIELCYLIINKIILIIIVIVATVNIVG